MMNLNDQAPSLLMSPMQTANCKQLQMTSVSTTELVMKMENSNFPYSLSFLEIIYNLAFRGPL